MFKRVIILIFSFGMAFALLQGVAADQPELVMLRVGWSDTKELNDLRSNYDVWQVLPAERTVLIAAERSQQIKLEDEGWPIVVDLDLTHFHLGGSNNQRGDDTFFAGYKTTAEIAAELESLSAQYPDLTELVDFGDSLCKTLASSAPCETAGGDSLLGHDLLALRITNEAISGTSQISGTQILSGTKPVFMLHSGMHPREIAVPEISLRFARHLLENYASDSEIRPLVDQQESWIIPLANPDGYDLVVLGTLPAYGGQPLLHRKNGRITTGCAWPSQSSSHFGVDLNRNHTFGWGPIGTSSNPCSMNFNGASGGSEPETAAFEALLESLFADQRGPGRTDPAPADTSGLLITLHSFGEVIIWSWGDGIFPNNIAPNHAELSAIGDKLAQKTGYRSIQGNDFGGVSGATDDHVYGAFGVSAFTVEVGTTFLQSYDYTSNVIWNEVRPGLLYAAEIAPAPYQLVFEPEPQTTFYFPFVANQSLALP